MNRAVQNLIEKVGMPFTDAVDCATLAPATVLGLNKETGSIEVGKNADFAVLDSKFDVVLTVRGGKVIYKRK